MPPDMALLTTIFGSNYPCLELICMVPKVFEPLKFDCIVITLSVCNERKRLYTISKRRAVQVQVKPECYKTWHLLVSFKQFSDLAFINTLIEIVFDKLESRLYPDKRN